MDAADELLSCLVGERQREDLPRLASTRIYQVRDAVDDDPRLASARAGEDQQRPIAVLDHFSLSPV